MIHFFSYLMREQLHIKKSPLPGPFYFVQKNKFSPFFTAYEKIWPDILYLSYVELFINNQ